MSYLDDNCIFIPVNGNAFPLNRFTSLEQILIESNHMPNIRCYWIEQKVIRCEWAVAKIYSLVMNRYDPFTYLFLEYIKLHFV